MYSSFLLLIRDLSILPSILLYFKISLDIWEIVLLDITFFNVITPTLIPKLTKAEQEQVEIQIKYEGYINLQETAIEKFKKLENKVIPADFEYKALKGISLEAIQKLDKFKPVSVGQASRISGISPADISVLLIYLEQFKKTKKWG